MCAYLTLKTFTESNGDCRDGRLDTPLCWGNTDAGFSTFGSGTSNGGCEKRAFKVEEVMAGGFVWTR